MDWGEEEEYYGVPRANTSDVIEAVLSKQSKRYLKRISQKTIFYHSQKYRTIFFAGNHKQVTLQMVDIDCHNRGTHEGALECASFLRKHYFPGMYFETSRGGVGINGYVIIDKQALSNQSYNKLTKELEKRLKEVAAKEGFDISDIEIKGSCPIIAWNNHAPNYKAGTLARLPRNIVAFHQQGTTTLTARELIDLVATPVPDYIPQPKIKKISGRKADNVSTQQRFRNTMLLQRHSYKDFIIMKNRNKYADVGQVRRIPPDDRFLFIAEQFGLSKEMSQAVEHPESELIVTLMLPS